MLPHTTRLHAVFKAKQHVGLAAATRMALRRNYVQAVIGQVLVTEPELGQLSIRAQAMTWQAISGSKQQQH